MVVRDYLNKNAAVTATLPNYEDLFAALSDDIIQINDICRQQELDKKGLAITKKSLKYNLIALAMDISLKTVAYAEFMQNNELSAEIRYTKTELMRCPDTVLHDRAQIIYQRADAIAPALIPYGVTASQLADLLILMNAYYISIPKPRLGITDKKQATDYLPVIFGQVDRVLHQIDILIDVLRYSNKEFYSAYKTARKIVDNGHRKMALKGNVCDSDTGKELHGATLIITRDVDNGNPQTEHKKYIKKTAKKGGFYIKCMPQGTYNIQITKPGYITGIFTMHVTVGILCRFNAALHPIKQ
jgi:hypothetical protein